MKIKLNKLLLKQSIVGRFQKQILDRQKRIGFLKSTLNSISDQQRQQNIQQIGKLNRQIAQLSKYLPGKK